MTVVTVPSTAVFPSASDLFAFAQKSTTSRTGLKGAAWARLTSGFLLIPPASGTSSSLAPLMIRIGNGTPGTVSKVNMLATTGAAAARRSGRFAAYTNVIMPPLEPPVMKIRAGSAPWSATSRSIRESR